MNSKPKALRVKQWLTGATATLTSADVPSSRLDAELLLAHSFGQNRTWLHAHSDDFVPVDIRQSADALLNQRSNRIPIAYLTGTKEFYGRFFFVDPRVLIPRPETEEVIELILRLDLQNDTSVIDIGSGSGCIGITLKSERPSWNVSLTDVSDDALALAKKNSTEHHVDVIYKNQDLLTGDQARYDLIVANLPYVARDYEISPDARAEPPLALFADDSGHQLIDLLITQAPGCLRSSGYLVLESDPWQQNRIIETAAANGLKLHSQRQFHVIFRTV